ncbi:hypothetical protein DRN69_07915 [Candidatus Pacearchaeota archaeon]|nr:MAG: hypothetical protein DRN69_07915 [Candidatus Pacearchaeota archaeon]
MNVAKFLPQKLWRDYKRNILNAGIKENPEKYFNKIFFIVFIVSFFTSLIFSFVFKQYSKYFFVFPLLFFIIPLFIFHIAIYFWISLNASTRIKKMETLFPEFLQLMASNLRAGMTVEQAFLSSARPELAPLDEEILKTGREITTGKDVISSFRRMSERIASEKIDKIINLIVTGLRAGGNISTLLESTASNMREKEFLEKRVASNVLTYVIFIFIAIGIGAPILFGLSTILVEIIIKLTAQLPEIKTANISMPFVLSSLTLNPKFVIYFSLVFLVVIDIISSLLIGLVNKGDEKYGLRYMLPLIAFSIGVFFSVRIFLYRFLAGTFNAIS